MTVAYIGLGSNIGDRAANLGRAIYLISQSVPILVTSSLYQTASEGYKDQPDFLNSVAGVDTGFAAGELLKMLGGVEVKMGRERPFDGAPRVIDLDLLFFDGAVINQPGLEVPHPRMHLRAFVLVPIAEIAPAFVHPVLHKSMKELLAELRPGYRVEKWVHNKDGGSG
jgi:2-amino-4-hydroxy-6-hydroxymethyldihydropteridine diphosphokinase